MMIAINKDDKIIFIKLSNVPFSTKKRASVYVCNKRMLDGLPQSFFGITGIALCIKSCEKFKWICADDQTLHEKINKFIDEL